MPTYKDTGALDPRSGGTGFTLHEAGSLLYGTGNVGPNGLAKLASGSAGQVLLTDGAKPLWSSGGYVAVAFNAANFTASAPFGGGATGTWVVGSGDQVTYHYARSFLNELDLHFTIQTSTITGGPNYLMLKVPAGLTIQTHTEIKIRVINGGVVNDGMAIGFGGETNVRIYSATSGSANFNNDVDQTYVSGQIRLYVS